MSQGVWKGNDTSNDSQRKKKGNQTKYHLTQATNYKSTLPVFIKKKKGAPSKQERSICGCQARLHPLVNNCFRCGRIVCSVEQEGPCFFCGHHVTPNNQPQKDPFGSTENSSFVKAKDHLDKLLDYDRTLAKRTTVFDDQGDYFDMNKWASKEEQELIQKKSELEEEKNQSTYTIDLLGRSVKSENEHKSLKEEINKDIKAFREQEQARERENRRLVEEEELRKLYSAAQRTEDGTICISEDLESVAPVYIEPETRNASEKAKRERRMESRIQHDYYNLDVEV